MPKILLVGCFSPQMHSIGDHAQTLALTKFLAKYYSDYSIIRLYRDNINLLADMKQVISMDDLIFVSSSGDFGSLHSDNGWHEKRKQILLTFPNNRVVQLPVSVYYEDTGEGYRAFELDKTFFCGLPNYFLLCRTPQESRLLNENFSCRVSWFPDFVFSLNVMLPTDNKRDGALLVLRNDRESCLLNRPARNKRFDGWNRFICRRFATLGIQLTSEPYEDIVAILESKFGKVTFEDAQISNVDIDDGNREQIIMNAVKLYGNYQLVVTDRFHAAVFASLTNTPCVALPGRIPHKIKGNGDLLPHVVYCEQLSDLSRAIREAMSLKPKEFDNTRYFDSFRRMVDDAFSISCSLPDSKVSEEVLEVVRKRRSIRSWIQKPVEPTKIKLLLEAASFAPSAANSQAVKVIAVQDQETLKLLKANTSPWIGVPPLAFLVLYDMGKQHSLKLDFSGWHNRFIWQDTACAMMNMMLVAESLGLKSCWASVQPENEKAIKDALGIIEGHILTSMLFVGYSNQRVDYEHAVHQGRPIKRSVHVN